MTNIIRFFIWSTLIAIILVVSTNNGGTVDMEWFGYKITTNVVIFITVLSLLILASLSFFYLLDKIFSFKINFNLFKTSPLKQKDKIIKNYEEIIDLTIHISTAINAGNLESIKKLEKKIGIFSKTPELKQFFLAQIAQLKGNFQEASNLFSTINNQNAQILALKSDLTQKVGLNPLDTESHNSIVANETIEVAQKILELNKKDEKTALLLFQLYQKQGKTSLAIRLFQQYKSIQISNSQEFKILYAQLAKELYIQKNYSKATKNAKIALKKDKNYMPAIIISVKSLIKQGFTTKAIRTTKKVWKTNPDLSLASSYNFIYRNLPSQKRFAKALALHKNNPNHFISHLMVGSLAIKLKLYTEALEYLRLSHMKNPTKRTCKLIAQSYKNGTKNQEMAEEFLKKAESY